MAGSTPMLMLLMLLPAIAVAAPAAAEEKTAKAEKPELAKPIVNFTPGFPKPQIREFLGRVSGVAVDKSGRSYMLHRGSRKWEEDTFDSKHNYQHKQRGPMRQPAIVEVDGNGYAIDGFAENFFYMPHGLTVDNLGRMWATDVARHQVVRIDPKSKKVEEIVGEAFVPGSDSSHLCQPTDVAVASNGDFFVADGYCNNRIMKFDKDGKFIAQFGKKPSGQSLEADQLNIPHGLSLHERMDLLCVADRENSRVQCFKAGLKDGDKFGEFVQSIDKKLGKVYDIDFMPNGELLILHTFGNGELAVVNIHNLVSDTTVGQFTYVAQSSDAEEKTRGFGAAHALASSPNGKFALVGSLSAVCDTEDALCAAGYAVPYQIFRFDIDENRHVSM